MVKKGGEAGDRRGRAAQSELGRGGIHTGQMSAGSIAGMPTWVDSCPRILGRSIAMGLREMDDWDHFEELDDASTWFFGNCHRKRIARRRCGASVKGRRVWSPTLLL
jgi:hypothetical protein